MKGYKNYLVISWSWFIERRRFLLACSCIRLLCTLTASQSVFCSASKDMAAHFLHSYAVAMDPQSGRTTPQIPTKMKILQFSLKFLHSSYKGLK